VITLRAPAIPRKATHIPGVSHPRHPPATPRPHPVHPQHPPAPAPQNEGETGTRPHIQPIHGPRRSDLLRFWQKGHRGWAGSSWLAGGVERRAVSMRPRAACSTSGSGCGGAVASGQLNQRERMRPERSLSCLLNLRERMRREWWGGRGATRGLLGRRGGAAGPARSRNRRRSRRHRNLRRRSRHRRRLRSRRHSSRRRCQHRNRRPRHPSPRSPWAGRRSRGPSR